MIIHMPAADIRWRNNCDRLTLLSKANILLFVLLRCPLANKREAKWDVLFPGAGSVIFKQLKRWS